MKPQRLEFIWGIVVKSERLGRVGGIGVNSEKLEHVEVEVLGLKGSNPYEG